MPKKTNSELDTALATINKDFGERTISFLGDSTEFDVARIPSGNFALDKALGGGIPQGKIIDIFGPPGAGKSSITHLLIGQAQKIGKCALIDAENAFDPAIAESSGVNIGDLLISQPTTMEQALEIIQRLIGLKDLSLIVVDSVAALTPRAELEGDFGDAMVGLQARLLSQGMRKLNQTMQTTDTTTSLILVNQIRDKFGAMAFAPQTEATGGRAIKFYASVRMDVTRTGNVKGPNNSIVGHTVRVRVVKNRFAAPFQEAKFDIIYSYGISNEGPLLDAAVEADLIKVSGAWFIDPDTGEKIGQGKLKAVTYLRENPEYAKALTDRMLNSND